MAFSAFPLATMSLLDPKRMLYVSGISASIKSSSKPSKKCRALYILEALRSYQ